MSDSDNTLDPTVDAVATVLTWTLATEFALGTAEVEHTDDSLRAILQPLRGCETTEMPEVIARELRSRFYQERLDDLVATNPPTRRPSGPSASLTDWTDRLATFVGHTYELSSRQRLTTTSAVTALLHRLGLRDDHTGRAGTGTAGDLLQ